MTSGTLQITLAILGGLVVGSCLAAVAYRLPRGLTLWGRSRCDACLETLRWFELLPLLSFALLRGRCCRCSSAISGRYPVLEALSGALAWRYGLDAQFARLACGAWLALLAVAVDAEFGILPDRVVLPGLGLGLISAWWTGLPDLHLLPLPVDLLLAPMAGGRVAAVGLGFAALLMAGAGGGAGWFLPWLTARLSRGGMGAGDAKLLAMIGAFLGWQGAVAAFFLGAICGAAVGLALFGLGRLRPGEPLPFGPYLALGAALGFALGVS